MEEIFENTINNVMENALNNPNIPLGNAPLNNLKVIAIGAIGTAAFTFAGMAVKAITGIN